MPLGDMGCLTTRVVARTRHTLERKQHVDLVTSKEGRSGLRPDTVLQRSSNVRLLLTGANTVKVKLPAGTLDCGPLGLRLLERFARPMSVREAAAEHAQGAREWMDLLNTLAGLVEHGVLYDVAVGPEDAEVRGYGFDNPRPHIEMLDDVTRTSRFIEAVEATVRPGDVVVDVGTGTGILAMAAARAGAEHVYAIEAGAIAEQAEQVVATNGFSDVITVLRGWSTSLTLPQRADVLVTETIGSDPLDERIVEIVTDARERLLSPDARIVPSRVSVLGTAVEVPEAAIATNVYTPGCTRRWQDAYGFDFRPLLTPERRLHDHRIPMATTRTWSRLAPAVRLVDIDLRTITSATVAGDSSVHVERAGQLDGALLHFEVGLAPGIAMSSDPLGPDDVASWSNVLTLVPSVEVSAGQELNLAYHRNVRGATTGLSVTVRK